MSEIRTLRRFSVVWACASLHRFASKNGRPQRRFRGDRCARGGSCPKQAAGYIREGQRSQAESTSLGQWQVGGLRAAHQPPKAPASFGSRATQCPAARQLAGSFGGMAAAKPPPGSMAAQPVSPVAAGYVNSGQRAITGRLNPFPIALGVAPAARAGFRGDQKPRCLHGSGQRSGVCGRLALLTFPTRSSGAGHGRYPPRNGACAVAGHLHLEGVCSAGGRPSARSLARRTAFWETQWGQLDRSPGALPVKPAGSLAAGDASALPCHLVAL
jgi:hypothetical protein